MDCRVCGMKIDQRACDGCGRMLSSAELFTAAPPLNPSVLRVAADRQDFAEREA